jgi:hypothetical protein
VYILAISKLVKSNMISPPRLRLTKPLYELTIHTIKNNAKHKPAAKYGPFNGQRERGVAYFRKSIGMAIGQFWALAHAGAFSVL